MSQNDAPLGHGLLGKALIYHRNAKKKAPANRLVNPETAVTLRDDAKALQLVAGPSLRRGTLRDCLLLCQGIPAQG